MSKPRFTFRFRGMVDGRFAFRAPTWRTKRRTSLDAIKFENKVAEWLISTVPTGTWSVGNGGSTPGFESLRPPVSYKTGNGLCVTLSRVVDVMRFEREFAVLGLDPTILVEAAVEDTPILAHAA